MAICSNCGAEISDTAKFCNKCGQPVNNASTTNQNSYDSYSQQNYNPNNYGSGSYTPNNGNILSQSNGGKVDFLIRRYFMGFGDFVTIGFILLIINIFLGQVSPGFYFFLVVGIVLLVAGIICQIYFVVAGVGTNNADAATQQAFKTFQERAFAKLNVDQEEVNEIAPITLLGFGVTPSITFSNLKMKTGGLYKYFTKDPVEAYRVNGGIIRSMLVQVSVYAFSQKQLLIYEGNIDISTGRIYDERTTEIFYQDITTIDKEEMLKKVKAGVFKKDYRIFHKLRFDINGVTRGTSFDTTRYSEDDIMRSITGMQSYIRDKKGEV